MEFDGQVRGRIIESWVYLTKFWSRIFMLMSWCDVGTYCSNCLFWDLAIILRYDIYLTGIGLTPCGSSTHLHTNHTQDTENGTYITIKTLGTSITIKKFKTNLGSAGRAPSLRVIPWHLPYNWGKSTEKISVRLAARTSQADTVQYKKYEQYNTQKKSTIHWRKSTIHRRKNYNT
jgi:hypothetical protein